TPGSSAPRSRNPLGVAIYSLSRGDMNAGETVFIAGGGPIGFLTVLAAKHKGAGRIIVSEPAESRRQLALKIGATEAVDAAKGLSAGARADGRSRLRPRR